MNLQQFRFLREAARHKFSLTEAARALHTSQPGISKAIIDLEEELGVPILARHGKRVKGLTAPKWADPSALRVGHLMLAAGRPGQFGCRFRDCRDAHQLLRAAGW